MALTGSGLRAASGPRWAVGAPWLLPQRKVLRAPCVCCPTSALASWRCRRPQAGTPVLVVALPSRAPVAASVCRSAVPAPCFGAVLVAAALPCTLGGLVPAASPGLVAGSPMGWRAAPGAPRALPAAWAGTAGARTRTAVGALRSLPFRAVDVRLRVSRPAFAVPSRFFLAFSLLVVLPTARFGPRPARALPSVLRNLLLGLLRPAPAPFSGPGWRWGFLSEPTGVSAAAIGLGCLLRILLHVQDPLALHLSSSAFDDGLHEL